MATEIEAKFRVDIKKAKALRAELGVPDLIRTSTMDSYFDLGDRPGTLRIRTEYIDEKPKEAYVTRKTPAAPVGAGDLMTVREEIEPSIVADEWRDWLVIFNSLGYATDVQVYKRRHKVNLALVGVDFQVCYDEVDDLGVFVEVEFASGTDPEVAARALKTLVFHWQDYGLSPEPLSYYKLAVAEKRRNETAAC